MPAKTFDGELDTEKIDDTVLALLALTMCDADRSWKSHDWDALGRLYEKGMIHNPLGKAKSVVLTPKGLQQSQELFDTMFRRQSE